MADQVKITDLLKSFKLHLNDKIEHERTIMSKIDRHLAGKDKITENIPYAVKVLCKEHGIDYEDVFNHALEMYDG